MEVLLTGGGSRSGAEFTKNLTDHGHNVTVLTHSEFEYPGVTVIPINWHTVNLDDFYQKPFGKVKEYLAKPYDLILFWHNSQAQPYRTSSPQIEKTKLPMKQWNYGVAKGETDHLLHTEFVNTLLPFFIVECLEPYFTENTKIGYMSSGIIHDTKPELLNYWVYKSKKYSWIAQMKAFSNSLPGIFFGIQPYDLDPSEHLHKHVNQIRRTIEFLEPKHNGLYVGRNFVDNSNAIFPSEL